MKATDQRMRLGASPLWRRAPLILLRYPTLMAALGCGAALVALAAASAPLFVAAVGDSALQSRLAQATPLGAGLEGSVRERFPAQPGTPPAFDVQRAIPMYLSGTRFLGAPVTTNLTDSLQATGSRGPGTRVRLMSRTGVLEHVNLLSPRAKGAWIPDTLARTLALAPGDVLALRGEQAPPDAPPVRVRIAGLYRALSPDPGRPYWRNFTGDIYPSDPDAPPPPPFVFLGAGGLEAVLAKTGGTITRVVEIPLEPKGVTVAEAHGLARAFASVGSECGDCSLATSLPGAITEAETTVAAVTPLAVLLAAMGTIVALAVVAAAGVYALARRNVEARLLFARGEHPAAFASRFALEATPAIVVGSAAGFLVALGVSRWVSGAPADSHALRQAALAVATRLPAALVLVALVGTSAFIRLYETGRPRIRVLPWLQWEVPVLALAAYLFWRLRASGGLVGGGKGEIAHVSLVVFLFPLALVGGLAGLVARGIHRSLAVFGRRTTTLPLPAFLAVRRLAVAQGLVVLLVAAAAVAFGSLLYARALVASLERTVDVKAHTYVGSDVQGTINHDQALPRRFPYPITKVALARLAATAGDAARTSVDLMGIDPATFGRAAYWQPSWGSMPRLTRGVRQSRGERLPVIVAGGRIPARPLALGDGFIPIRIVAFTPAFPGADPRRPLVVSSFAALHDAFEHARVADPLGQLSASSLVWVKGPEALARRALLGSPLRPYYLRSSADVLREPQIAAEERSFSFMSQIGLAAGLLALVGLLLYLQARQRSRIIASALSRRMGLGALGDTLSLAFELMAVLFVAFLVGAAGSLVAARLVLGHVDPLAYLAPDPLFRPPLASIVTAGLALVPIAVVGGAVTRFLAARANFAEIMRLG
jgi:putative ABC transport system permease protein